MKKKFIINETQAKKILRISEQNKAPLKGDRPPKKPIKPVTSKAGYDCKAIGDFGTKCVPHGLPNEEAYQAYGVYSPYSGFGNWQNPSPMYPTYDACMNSIPSDSWAYNEDSWECKKIPKPQKPDNSDPTSDANPDGTSTDPWTYHYNNINNLGMPNFGCLDPAASNYAYWDHVSGDCGLPVTDIDDIPEGSYGSTSCCIYGDWSYQDWLDGQSISEGVYKLRENSPGPIPVTRYRIDAGGCIECPSSANAQQCPYTEPTCGEGQDPDPSEFSGGPEGGPRPQKNKKRRGKGLPRMQKTRK